ncbi:MAG: ABC transporter permease DevC [Chthoniobacterales bacterium]
MRKGPLARALRYLLPLGIPLAWLQLAGEKRRLAAAVAGIAFAAIMMMMQLGFHDALFESTTILHSHLRGDLAMVSTQYESLISTKSFTQRRVYQALALPEVIAVAPVYLGMANWKNPQSRRDRSIFVFGFNPDDRVLDLPEVIEKTALLKLPDSVFFDSGSRPEFGPIAQELKERGQVETEIAGRKVTVNGVFRLGTSFAADGNVVTSGSTFLSIFKARPEGLVDLGVIRLAPGTDAVKTCDRLRALLPPDVQVVTRAGYMQLEKEYWGKRTPIGFIITASMIVAFVVGSVIVYQILYTDVVDHLQEYATLKAVGYTDARLFALVLQQAVILSLLGFIPATLMAALIFHLTRAITMLPAYLTFGRALLVLALTMLMCTVSGALAMRKLRAADPAEIF